jgi:hypothetical protein
MPAAADDHMVVDRDAERLGGADDILGHRDIGLGWLCTRSILVAREGGRALTNWPYETNYQLLMILPETPGKAA